MTRSFMMSDNMEFFIQYDNNHQQNILRISERERPEKKSMFKKSGYGFVLVSSTLDQPTKKRAQSALDRNLEFVLEEYDG